MIDLITFRPRLSLSSGG